MRSLKLLSGVVSLAALLSAAGIASASASSPVAKDSSKSPITIALPYANYFVPPVKLAVAACAKEGVPIDIQQVNADYNDFNLKLDVEAQAGTAPDIAVQGLDEVGAMGQSQYVANLSTSIKGVSGFSKSDMPLLSVGDANGKLVSIPWGVSLPVVWINSTLFKAAGLNPNQKIQTWSQLATTARKLTDTSKKQYGVGIGLEEGWIPLNFLLSSGSNLTTNSGKVEFDNTAGLKAASYVNGLYTSGSAFPGDETQATAAFIAGHVAMMIMTSANVSSMTSAKFQWTAQPFPAMNATTPVKLAAGGVGVSVFAPKDLRAETMKAVQCLFQAPVLKSVVSLGYLPVRSDLSSTFATIDKSAPYEQALSQYNLVGPWYNFPGANGAQANTDFQNAWVQATQESKKPSSVLKAAATSIASVLNEQ